MKKKKDELFSWVAPTRPYKKRDAVYYQTIFSLGFLLVIIAFFLHEWLLVGSVLAVVFVSYALSAVPPPMIKNKITEKGIWHGEQFFPFDKIKEYWFEEQLENIVLIFNLRVNNPLIVLVINKKDKEEIDNILSKKLVFREKPLKGTIEKIGKWLQSKILFEEEKKTHKTPIASN